MGVSRVPPRPLFVLFVFWLAILRRGCAETVSELCELGIKDKNKLYQYNLVSPRPNFPHGILSKDGFYKVAANGTVLWFQVGSVSVLHGCHAALCFDDFQPPPMCVNREDCGPSCCGMGCSALSFRCIYAGYPVCITLGRPSSIAVPVQEHRAEASIWLRQVISASGSGLGWFGTLMIIILCLFGAYLLAGAVYRYSILHVCGIDVIPNLEFWASVPHRVQIDILSKTVQGVTIEFIIFSTSLCSILFSSPPLINLPSI